MVFCIHLFRFNMNVFGVEWNSNRKAADSKEETGGEAGTQTEKESQEGGKETSITESTTYFKNDI